MGNKLVNGKLIELTQEEITALEESHAKAEKERPAREAQQGITELESQITPRRIREALLTSAGKAWLETQEANIKKQRKKLSK